LTRNGAEFRENTAELFGKGFTFPRKPSLARVVQYPHNKNALNGRSQVIFATAMTLGVVVGMMRSAASVAIVAALMGLSFIAAMLISPGPVSFLSLVLAVAGYNAALLGHVVVLLAVDRTRRAA
jgi:hypothetical protein